jgi:signal peptide peptidase-like protein 2B
MVDVATGGSTKSRCGKPGEQLPMVLRVPHQLFRSDSTDPLDVCFPNRDSILGFGDILVPGLLVSYCHAFDLIFGIKYRIYYITTSICYGLGLITTFAGIQIIVNF